MLGRARTHTVNDRVELTTCDRGGAAGIRIGMSGVNQSESEYFRERTTKVTTTTTPDTHTLTLTLTLMHSR